MAYYFSLRMSVYPLSYKQIEYDFYQGYCVDHLPLREAYGSEFGCDHIAHFFVNTFGVPT